MSEALHKGILTGAHIASGFRAHAPIAIYPPYTNTKHPRLISICLLLSRFVAMGYITYIRYRQVGKDQDYLSDCAHPRQPGAARGDLLNGHGS